MNDYPPHVFANRCSEYCPSPKSSALSNSDSYSGALGQVDADLCLRGVYVLG